MDLLYLISFPVEPELGLQEKPLLLREDRHLTLLSAFSVPNRNISDLIASLDKATAWLTPINVSLKEHETFYCKLNREIPVAVVKESVSNQLLINVHKTFKNLVESNNGRVNDPLFNGDGYKPHISYWDGKGSFLFNSVSLMWHSEGFGKSVINLANYYFDERPTEIFRNI